MSPILAGSFALFIAAAGWFYAFYSRSAQRMASVEAEAINQRRIRLRRVGGVLLIGLAMLFYVGAAGVDWSKPTLWFAAIWLAVLLLLAIVTWLALVDLRLTQQLRKRRP